MPPPTSTVVEKRIQETLYVLLDFENKIAMEALVDSRTYVSAIAQKEFDTIQQGAPSNILKTDHLPNFQLQLANGQLEEPLSTAAFKVESGQHIF